MANKDEPHELEKIIARKDLADAKKATQRGKLKNWGRASRRHSLQLRRPCAPRLQKPMKLSSEAGEPRNFGTSPIPSPGLATC